MTKSKLAILNARAIQKSNLMTPNQTDKWYHKKYLNSSLMTQVTQHPAGKFECQTNSEVVSDVPKSNLQI